MRKSPKVAEINWAFCYCKCLGYGQAPQNKPHSSKRSTRSNICYPSFTTPMPSACWLCKVGLHLCA